ncbi:GNAT family N-acetyltransferase [Runella salmonicolor]|jgi:GNAT superfamily N-acetyltransferase|uniref:GNAT family N-acetyltransferase n=1 Tax=Runella salmonicolor TaxID=2950278 RepID=A0ABT1FTJ0_9BACT|nr:GNAT family N-acetyltransferase [Runella salmonicolor]MCP1384073.1 GNAT family N-acetyltransferase [Runella salmonicolor]
MNIVIRKGTPEDFPAIFQLIQEFAVFQKTPEKVTITLDQMLENKDLFQCLVVEKEDAQLIGFASFFMAYYSWSGKALYLDDLYVKKEFRGHQIGTQLLDRLIDYANAEQCKKVRWQVSNWNKEAIEFYKKMGAKVDDTEINCDLYL